MLNKKTFPSVIMQIYQVIGKLEDKVGWKNNNNHNQKIEKPHRAEVTEEVGFFVKYKRQNDINTSTLQPKNI